MFIAGNVIVFTVGRSLTVLSYRAQRRLENPSCGARRSDSRW